MPNSHAALNVAELARERGVHVHQQLMHALWAEDQDISDPEVLANVTGLDPDEVRRAVTERPYEDLIRASTQAVQEMGAGGVPAFVVADRVLIPGAQPHSLFEKVMGKLEIDSVESPDDAAATES